MRNAVKKQPWFSVPVLGLAFILLFIPLFSACSSKTASDLPKPAAVLPKPGSAVQQAAPTEKPTEISGKTEDEIPDLPLKGSYTLTSGTAYGVATRFPDTWELAAPTAGSDYFVIQRKNPGPGNVDNINIIVSQKIGRDLLQSDLPDFKAMFKEELAIYGLDASNMKMVSISGIPSFYYDYYTQLSDEAIDFAVENGMLTQDVVDYYGKDALKDLLQCYQVVGVASIDGTVIVVTGTYYDEKDKAEIVDIVNLLISNAKIVS